MPSSTSAWVCLLGPPLETGNIITENLKRLCRAPGPGCDAVPAPILPYAATSARRLYRSELKKLTVGFDYKMKKKECVLPVLGNRYAEEQNNVLLF